MKFFARECDLRALQRTQRLTWAGDYQDRARWLALFYRSGAYLDFNARGDDLIVTYGLSERDADNCFEMGDSADVLQALLAGADDELLRAIAQANGAHVLAEWQARAANDATQPSLF